MSMILTAFYLILFKARAYMPLKAKAVVDMREKTFKLMVEPPKTPKEILVLETRPVTFTRVWPKTIQVWKEDEEKTIVGEEHNRVLAVSDWLSLSHVTKKLLGNFWIKG